MAKIHASHIGIQGCLRRALEVLYWPWVNKEVEESLARCKTCNNYHSEQAREPIICHELPTRPWEKVAVDIFEVNQKDFLITVDYCSSFFKVDQPTAKTAREVINKIKPHFSRHGIPDMVVSDNGQPFATSDFQEFTNLYCFRHVTSSPGCPQSNGKVENAVKMAKKLMTKALPTKYDPYLVLLYWRNTPSKIHHQVSESAAGISRVYCQCLASFYSPRYLTLIRSSNDRTQNSPSTTIKEKGNYRSLSLVTQYVYNQEEKPKKNWVQAQVDEKVDIRSYHIRTGRR